MSEIIWETKEEAMKAIASETSLDVLYGWFIILPFTPQAILKMEKGVCDGLTVKVGERMLELYSDNEAVVTTLFYSNFSDRLFKDLCAAGILADAFVQREDAYICPDHKPAIDFLAMA